MSLPQTPSGGAPGLRRGALAVTAVVLSFTVLTACGAGNNAQSLGVKPDTAAVTVDTISVQNANVITQPEAGTAGPAVVSATVFNKGDKDQTIESITLPGGTGAVKLSPAKGSGPLIVPALGSIVIGGKGNATAVIDDGTALTQNIGGVQKTVFRFSETGDVELKSFVMPATGDFKDFGPSSLPTPPATAQSPGASGKPAEAASKAASGRPGSEGEASETDAGAEAETGTGAETGTEAETETGAEGETAH
ncbi:hypothetical protein [Streptomyces jumonjinensis]|uniref:DUF461 domain-containing protein n=1 Tax=Streptomyces jumonjinensis TaxID=1945 RepID=A0A646KRG2_STRJU|nr:hypothetical protein [Streptomyces jumonjinensis]MQT04843.1 hypothetical protein [Streptomyces jumonjinensis]